MLEAYELNKIKTATTKEVLRMEIVALDDKM
jgi:hypothetical protein